MKLTRIVQLTVVLRKDDKLESIKIKAKTVAATQFRNQGKSTNFGNWFSRKIRHKEEWIEKCTNNGFPFDSKYSAEISQLTLSAQLLYVVFLICNKAFMT